MPLRGAIHRRLIEKKKSHKDLHEKKGMDLGKKIAIGIGIFFGLILIIGIIASVYVPSSTEQEISNEPTVPSTPVQETNPLTFSIGEPIAIGDVIYTVEDVFTIPILGTYGVKADGIFVIVKVSIENKGNEKVIISSADFTIKDSSKRTYDVDSDSIFLSSFGIDPLIFDNLGAGLKTTRGVAFDVPEDDTGLILEIDRGVFSGGKLVQIGDVESIE